MQAAKYLEFRPCRFSPWQIPAPDWLSLWLTDRNAGLHITDAGSSFGRFLPRSGSSLVSSPPSAPAFTAGIFAQKTGTAEKPFLFFVF